MLFDVEQQTGLMGDLYTPEDKKAALTKALMSFGSSALANSGWSSTPTSLGQAIGPAISQGMTAYESGIQQAVKNALLKRQIAKQDKEDELKEQEREQSRKAREAAVGAVPENLKEAFSLDPDIAKAAANLGTSINTPAGLIEFNAMTQGLTPEDRDKARRVALGLEGRASSAGYGWQKVLGQDGRERLVRVDPRTGDVIQGDEEFLASPTLGAQEGMKQSGKDSVSLATESFKQLAPIRKNISNYNEAIRLIDEGASTGVIQSMLPSVRASSVQLDNMQGQLGLDVIGNTTFGALSENELKFALDTSLPTNLQGQDLKDWLRRKRDAQQKMHDYIEDATIYLGTPGNTIASYLNEQKNKKGSKGNSQPSAQQNTVNWSDLK